MTINAECSSPSRTHAIHVIEAVAIQNIFDALGKRFVAAIIVYLLVSITIGIVSIVLAAIVSASGIKFLAALSGVSIFIGALLVGGVFFFVLLALGEISESLSDVRKTLTDINETLSMNSVQKGAVSSEKLIEDDSE